MAHMKEAAIHSAKSRRPRSRIKIVSTFLVAVLAIGAVGFGVERLRAENSDARMAQACIDQYNTMVGQAKADLTRGDRIAAINSLVAARAQLHRCEVPSGVSVSGIWH
jgi:hypothetical protein